MNANVRNGLFVYCYFSAAGDRDEGKVDDNAFMRLLKALLEAYSARNPEGHAAATVKGFIKVRLQILLSIFHTAHPKKTSVPEDIAVPGSSSVNNSSQIPQAPKRKSTTTTPGSAPVPKAKRVKLKVDTNEQFSDQENDDFEPPAKKRKVSSSAAPVPVPVPVTTPTPVPTPVPVPAAVSKSVRRKGKSVAIIPSSPEESDNILELSPPPPKTVQRVASTSGSRPPARSRPATGSRSVPTPVPVPIKPKYHVADSLPVEKEEFNTYVKAFNFDEILGKVNDEESGSEDGEYHDEEGEDDEDDEEEKVDEEDEEDEERQLLVKEEVEFKVRYAQPKRGKANVYPCSRCIKRKQTCYSQDSLKARGACYACGRLKNKCIFPVGFSHIFD